MSSSYRGPLGDTTKKPDAEFIRSIVDKPAEYWAVGGGDSCLEVDGTNERMIFFFDEPYGFFIMMHPDYEVMVRNSDRITTVEHRVGGEPMRVPSCSYVNRDEAYSLMTEYLGTEARPTSVEWHDLFAIDFDHGI